MPKKTLYAEFTVKPASEAIVAALMEELASKVRQEPGNELFLPFTLEVEPRKYFVFEVYTDQDAFTEHINADYGREFNQKLASHIEGTGSVLTWLTPLLQSTGSDTHNAF